MKIDLNKIELAKATAIMGTGDMLKAAEVSRGTWAGVLRNGTASPKTTGKIAKALGVDVSEILVVEKRRD